MKKNSEPYSNFRTGKRTLCNDHLWLFFFLLRQMFLWNSLTLFHMVSFFFYWLLLGGSEDDLRLYTTVWQQAPNYTSSVSHFLVTCFVWLLGKQSYFGCIVSFLRVFEDLWQFVQHRWQALKLFFELKKLLFQLSFIPIPIFSPITLCWRHQTLWGYGYRFSTDLMTSLILFQKRFHIEYLQST